MAEISVKKFQVPRHGVIEVKDAAVRQLIQPETSVDNPLVNKQYVDETVATNRDDFGMPHSIVTLEPTIGYIDSEFLPIIRNKVVHTPMTVRVVEGSGAYTLSVNATPLARFDSSGNFLSEYSAAADYVFNGHPISEVTISFYGSDRYILEPFSSATISSSLTSATVSIGYGNFGTFSATLAYAPLDIVVYNGGLWKCVQTHSPSAWNNSHFVRISRDMWVTFRGSLELVTFEGGFNILNGQSSFTTSVTAEDDNVHHIVEYDSGKFSYSMAGLHGQTMQESPTQRQIADALKALWVLNGGTIGA